MATRTVRSTGCSHSPLPKTLAAYQGHQNFIRPISTNPDQAREATQWLVRHPEWPLGAALLLVLLRPGRVLRWASLGLQGYGVYRRVQRVMARPLSRAP